jgi:AcrR family transcriptional regulator
MTTETPGDTNEKASLPGRPAARRLPAQQRRQQLVGVALTLFAERGFDATTMDDIAEAAGVTKPLLYQHFTSKRALYLELVDQVAEQLLGAISEAAAKADGPRQMVEVGFTAYFRMVTTHEAAFRLLFGSDTPNDPELSGALRRVEQTIGEGVTTLIDAELDPSYRRLLAAAVVATGEAGCRHWLATRSDSPGFPDTSDAELMARRLADLIWGGLRSVHRD